MTAINILIRDARDKGVRMVLVFDPELKWQVLSFEALHLFERPDGLLKFSRGSSASHRANA